MKENDVAYFGTLLGKTPEEVVSAEESGTLGEQLKQARLMRGEDVDVMKANLVRETKSQHLSELVEQAKRSELDGDLYKTIKGATLEMLEKDLAREYKVDEFKDVRDLVAKAIKNNTAKTDDTKLQELLQENDHLKEANQRLVSEKAEVEQTTKKEYEGRLLKREKTDIVSSLPFDFSDVDEKDLEKVTDSRRKILTDVFDARYAMEFKDDKIVIKDREGNPLLNDATYEPIPASDVMKRIASELGIKLKSPETGGQGGKSSIGSSGKFKTYDAYVEWCEKKGYLPTSPEGIRVLNERGVEQTI